jgi:hypothetical protein
VSCLALCFATVLDLGSAPVAAKVQPLGQPPLRPAAVLTLISGNVLTRFGASGFAPASDGAVLYVGSTVRTGTDARAVITLFEGSTVELEPASDILIEEATLRSGSTIVELAQSIGRSWHVVTHLTTADSRYEVKTPAATASVRGTAFEVAIDDTSGTPTTTVTTTEGRVATADAAASTEVLVTADQTTTVRANTAPEPPRSAPDAQRVVSVTTVSDSALVIDPLGRANGIKDGRILAQTPGARVRTQDGTIVVTLPNVPDGVFATTATASSGAPVSVSTTVTDRGEEPVTLTNTADNGSTTGVDLRKGADRPQVRPLSDDETERFSDARPGAKKAHVRPATPTRRASATAWSTPRVSDTLEKSSDATPQPATTPRRTPPPSPSPTRR